jgi:23S rRNA pseudouridine1911/1915/1917 synthase
VLIFARTSKALTRLNNSFADRETTKIYWAVVKNDPPKKKDTLIHFLKRNPKQNKSYANIKEVPDSKRAVLHYEILKKLDNFTALEIRLETGRHHQIRSQLSSINCPIKGDLKYGSDRSNKDGSIHLHARKITFMHPVKKEEITIIAPTPSDNIWKSISKP